MTLSFFRPATVHPGVTDVLAKALNPAWERAWKGVEVDSHGDVVAVVNG